MSVRRKAAAFLFASKQHPLLNVSTIGFKGVGAQMVDDPMKGRDIRKDLQPSAGDAVHTLARTGVGIVPLVGGTLAELINASVTAPLSRRRDEWLMYLADGVLRLQERVADFDWEQRMKDPAFVSLFLEACQIAVRNHREEKLHALRNAVLNAAAGIDVEEDVRFTFLAIIERFTASHLDVLAFAYYPRGWMERNGVPVPDPLPRTWSAKQTCLMEYQKDALFLDMIVGDLQGARLIEVHPFTALDNSVSPGRVSLNYTSDLGKRFYLFFSEPRALADAPTPNHP